MTSPQSGGFSKAKPLAIAFAGAISLAVALGIGRFAFTPLLPMMLHDGVIDLHGGSVLATANYIGYLLGAMMAAVQPGLQKRFARFPRMSSSGIVRAALIATIILTAGMALPVPALWPALRLIAGIVSAYALVFTAGWCLAHLARHDRARLGGVIFMGPGIGITGSGLVVSALNVVHVSAATGWLAFTVLGLLLTALVWRIFHGSDPLTTTAAPASAGTNAAHSQAQVTLLVLAYGLAGFGYIITATFLPVIARETLPPSIWIDQFWSIFGIGTIAGALLSLFVSRRTDPRHALTIMYATQAIGVASTVLFPTLTGFAIGSFLVGLPMTVITLFAMQEGRRLRPHHAAALLGLLTAVYGIGQIIGPPLVAVLLTHAQSHAQGFALSLTIASTTLAIGAALFLTMARVWPISKPANR